MAMIDIISDRYIARHYLTAKKQSGTSTMTSAPYVLSYSYMTTPTI